MTRLASSRTKNSTPKMTPSRIFDQMTFQKTLLKWTSRNHNRST